MQAVAEPDPGPHGHMLEGGAWRSGIPIERGCVVCVPWGGEQSVLWTTILCL